MRLSVLVATLGLATMFGSTQTSGCPTETPP
jgi:hypothetical protein